MEHSKAMKPAEEIKFLETRDIVKVEDSEDVDDAELDAEIDVEKNVRGQWGNKVEFFLAIMGYTVGSGSVWRFPIVCSRNGGGAFLIPFFFFLLTCGGPLYYMEVCLGQFSGKSAGLAFEFCPLLKGLGLLQVILSATCVWNAVCISTWTYYYLYASFSKTQPWAQCGNPWNTPLCTEFEVNDPDGTFYNTTSSVTNFSVSLKGSQQYQSPAFEFWEHKVIGRSSGMDDVGELQPHLVICLSLAWILTSLAVIKGAQTIGKFLDFPLIILCLHGYRTTPLAVVYVTATAPYLLLTIMFVRGLNLDGAKDGIIAFLKPDFAKLFTIQTWLEAAIQVFFSLGPTWGGVITMASYNRFHQKSFWSSTMCVVSSGFTSFYNGLVVFTILGFMAKSSGLPVQAVAKQSGPGLTFVAFPIALSKMPLSQLWSVLFFLTLVTVTFDSLFGMFETVSSGIIDLFPRQLTTRRVYVNIGLAVFLIFTGLPFCLNGDIYLFQLSDWYFSQFALLFGSLFECLAVCWFYGTDRFSHDIHLMTGRDVAVLLRVMWTVFIPIVVLIVFLIMLSKYSAPAYGDGYIYGSGYLAFGISVGLLPIVGAIIVGLITLVRTPGTFIERLRRCSKPSKYWLPSESDARREYKMKPYSYPRTLKQRILVDLLGKRTI